MSDPASTARAARESLSKGLNALQSDPNLPPQLMELAAPIAQAMGALHQIERSNGAQLLPYANIALEKVRAALAQLQTGPQNFAAIAAAMEAVASSLGQVHALSKLAGPAQASPQPAPQPAPKPQVASPQQFVPQAAPQQFVPQPVPQQPAFPPPQQAYVPPPQAAPQYAADPFAAPRAQNSPMASTAYAAPQAAPMRQPAPQPARQVAPQAPPPAGDLPVISADLGAQSPTNFYKGLSGNDIIDHGGLFISTYKIPKIGTPVRLKVSLPGGYEFEANAVVRWSREGSDGGDSAPPGFGAQFTHITQESRQLIYRYVRNREPLFHDDL
ncbi:MAG: PilZ domain-containing protein [Polyangiaceae bacterium]